MKCIKYISGVYNHSETQARWKKIEQSSKFNKEVWKETKLENRFNNLNTLFNTLQYLVAQNIYKGLRCQTSRLTSTKDRPTCKEG